METPVISVSINTENRPKIMWDTVEDATKYDVYRYEGTGTYEEQDEVGFTSLATKVVKDIEALEYIDDSELEEYSFYYYAIKAKNDTPEETDFSNIEHIRKHLVRGIITEADPMIFEPIVSLNKMPNGTMILTWKENPSNVINSKKYIIFEYTELQEVIDETVDEAEVMSFAQKIYHSNKRFLILENKDPDIFYYYIVIAGT